VGPNSNVHSSVLTSREVRFPVFEITPQENNTVRVCSTKNNMDATGRAHTYIQGGHVHLVHIKEEFATCKQDRAACM
jgi:hypothetical protein